MKANSLHKDEIYAYANGGYKRQGDNPLPLNCVKVKYIENKQHIPIYGQRLRTVCLVEVVEAQGYQYPVGKVIEVPARHLIDFWDHYQEERDIIVSKKNASTDEITREREQYRQRRQEIKERLALLLGIDPTRIRVDSVFIELRTKDVEAALEEIAPIQQPEENGVQLPVQDLMEGIQGLIEGKF